VLLTDNAAEHLGEDAPSAINAVDHKARSNDNADTGKKRGPEAAHLVSDRREIPRDRANERNRGQGERRNGNGCRRSRNSRNAEQRDDDSEDSEEELFHGMLSSLLATRRDNIEHLKKATTRERHKRRYDTNRSEDGDEFKELSRHFIKSRRLDVRPCGLYVVLQ
jgi:hypothetical protein